MIQATLFQLDNYGPWTTTPSPRREMDLQVLQAELYADVASFVGDRQGYAFYARGDNILAFTNGLDDEDHGHLQASVRNRYPVTLSAGIGSGQTPRAAVADASERLQQAGSAQDSDRIEVLRGDPVADPGDLTVAHFDVVDATGRYTDSEGAFGSHLAISRAAAALSERLYREYDGLGFFVGGDNVIAVCPPTVEEYGTLVDDVAEATGVALQVGVGSGETAASAGMDAKHALEEAREQSTAVVRSGNQETGAVQAMETADGPVTR